MGYLPYFYLCILLLFTEEAVKIIKYRIILFSTLFFILLFLTLKINNFYGKVLKSSSKINQNRRKKWNNNILNNSFSVKYVINMMFSKAYLCYGIGGNFLIDLRSIRNFHSKAKQNLFLSEYFQKKYPTMNNYKKKSYYKGFIINQDFEKLLEKNIDMEHSNYDPDKKIFILKFKIPAFTLNQIQTEEKNPLKKAKIKKKTIEDNKIKKDTILDIYQRKIDFSTKVDINRRLEEENIMKEVGYMNFFNNQYQAIEEKDRTYCIPLDKKRTIWHGGLWFFGSNGLHQAAVETVGIAQGRAAQTDIVPNENYIVSPVTIWEEVLHNLMAYYLIKTIGTSMQNGDVRISKSNMLEVCKIGTPLNKLWFPSNNQSDTILNSSPEKIEAFYLRFKTKGFGYIEEENGFEDVNKQSSELLSEINSTIFLIPSLDISLSFKTMLSWMKRDLAYDLLINIKFPRKEQMLNFLGKKTYTPIHITIGGISRLLLKKIPAYKLIIWGGLGMEISTSPMISSQRSLITEKKIREFIATYTENNMISCNVLNDFIKMQGSYWTLNLVIVFEIELMNCFFILNLKELSKGILDIKISFLYKNLIWKNSTQYIEEIIIEKNEMEEQDYLRQIYV